LCVRLVFASCRYTVFEPKMSDVPELPIPLIESRIYTIRGHKVLLDADLALLYEVQTKRLNEAVRRKPGAFSRGFLVSADSRRDGSFEVANCDLKRRLRRRRYTPIGVTKGDMDAPAALRPQTNWGGQRSGCNDVAPRLKSPPLFRSIPDSGKKMSFCSEMSSQEAMDLKKSLRMLRRLKALHPALSLSSRLMGVLRAVVQIPRDHHRQTSQLWRG
jgi:ORF6N domain